MSHGLVSPALDRILLPFRIPTRGLYYINIVHLLNFLLALFRTVHSGMNYDITVDLRVDTRHQKQ